MKSASIPVIKDLVLIGGGHSHVAVVKSFGMKPLPGVRVTLISKDVNTPYSGMLPGCIAGHYTLDEIHIDLHRLCQWAGVRFYRSEFTGLDLAEKVARCDNRPPVAFNFVSIDTGSLPHMIGIPGADRFTLPAKPVDQLLREWPRLIERMFAQRDRPFRVVIVGGGAGGVELTLSMQHRVKTECAERGQSSALHEFHLLTDSATILPTHNPRVRQIFERILHERGVRVHVNHRVSEVTERLVMCETGETIEHDAVIWVTTAAAPAWIADCGLATDERGFVQVHDTLQSTSHAFVFAAGDVASVLNYPRPKSGVFAVRQGPPLACNLRLALQHLPPRPFTPQKNFLGLISTGDRYAVASRGGFALEGAWLWRMKQWIDLRWMKQYRELPAMPPPHAPEISEGIADAAAISQLAATPMRCGGCGAKVGSAILSRVLSRLEPVLRGDVLVGLNDPDDAAITLPPPGMALVHTVDFFRALIDDPYLFGKIAVNHCLGDIFAMGGEPQSALAIATLPHGLEEKVEQQLQALMTGALEMLRAENTALAGGHTGEGAELAFGLAVSGVVDPAKILRKSGLQRGDCLILAKPIGTGVIFAAHMQGKAKGDWIEAALASMLHSNRAAAECFSRHQATACTDITGFGLLGHLIEMTQASGVGAELHLSSVPWLHGAREATRDGVTSSLQPQNLRLHRAIANLKEAASNECFPLLFDPQTAGGLLTGIPASQAHACLAILNTQGYPHASIIGHITATTNDSAMIRVIS